MERRQQQQHQQQPLQCPVPRREEYEHPQTQCRLFLYPPLCPLSSSGRDVPMFPPLSPAPKRGCWDEYFHLVEASRRGAIPSSTAPARTGGGTMTGGQLGGLSQRSRGREPVSGLRGMGPLCGQLLRPPGGGEEGAPLPSVTGRLPANPTFTTREKLPVAPTSTTRGRLPAAPTSITKGRLPAAPTSTTRGRLQAAPTSTIRGRLHAAPTSITRGRLPAAPTSTTRRRLHAAPTSITRGRLPAAPTSTTRGRLHAAPTSITRGRSGAPTAALLAGGSPPAITS
ncbi:UNVERIFIED_CONTAM: hypothetical protein FKN15_024836 [Acipenser sinensis]